MTTFSKQGLIRTLIAAAVFILLGYALLLGVMGSGSWFWQQITHSSFGVWLGSPAREMKVWQLLIILWLCAAISSKD